VAQPAWPLRALGCSGALWMLIKDGPLELPVPYGGVPYSQPTQTLLAEDSHDARVAPSISEAAIQINKHILLA